MKTARTVGLLLLLGATAGCYSVEMNNDPRLSTFQVTVQGLYLPRTSATGARNPLPVVAECSRRYGNSQSRVPPELRGTPDCRYAMPRGEVEVDVEVTAIDQNGRVLADLEKPISFRVVPGNLTGGYPFRWKQLTNGVANATVKVSHMYSETRLWAEDAPPKPIFIDGGVMDAGLPQEPESRTYAAGVSAPVYFEEPTLAKIQYPDGFDNRSSPLVGQFIAVGKNPESGGVLKLSCPDDPARDGQVSALLVTGVDQSGFFVTDLNACRVKEDLVNATGGIVTRIPEPDGYYPGTFGSIYVYNFSYPEGLSPGDLLWTVAGSIQEFTSTTQMTFASWSLRERVRLLPEAEWKKYLNLLQPVEISARVCNLDTTLFLTDALCGQNRGSLKLESLESTLVKLRNVKFPQVFTNCDFNANGEVPFFCEGRPDNVTWAWGPCTTITGPDVDLAERTCNINCTIGLGPEFQGKVCSERNTYSSFGQFVVELAGPGPLEANLDPSIPQRMNSVIVSGTSARTSATYATNTEVKVWCDTPVHYRVGGASVVATAADPVLPANTVLERTMKPGEFKVAFLASGTAPAQSRCVVGENPRTRVNLTLRDVLPDLNLDCDVNDLDQEKAQECLNLRGARYDVVGHLRHVQPARPRWMVMPRDANDVCCRPGPGLSCPKLIKPCAGG